jgi:hypothetical protein
MWDWISRFDVGFVGWVEAEGRNPSAVSATEEYRSMMGFASLNPSYNPYSFFTASFVAASSPHTGASAPSPQLRGR